VPAVVRDATTVVVAADTVAPARPVAGVVHVVVVARAHHAHDQGTCAMNAVVVTVALALATGSTVASDDHVHADALSSPTDTTTTTAAVPPPADDEAPFLDADGDGVDDALLPPAPAENEAPAMAGETVVGRRRDARRVTGSAHVVDKETLERFEADDVHRVLRSVPGVYVRDEDGFGLRPNIGLRGASSDRSAKVTLLEDGVLFAPAPYAAPAAYYFPLTTRIVGLEVWKGPAAIRQGPHTVGGALNVRTRAVPLGPTGGLDLGVGVLDAGNPPPGIGGDLDRLGRPQARLHGFFGTSTTLEEILGPAGAHLVGGVVIEGARVATDGFKTIDGRPELPTGFVREDVLLKARVMNELTAAVRHTLELKLGAQREESFETYLGLSDDEFRADPDRRFAASAADQMHWTRTQAQLRYGLSTGSLDVDVVAYRHDLDRTWRKVNGVRGAPNLHDVLTYPDAGAHGIFRARLGSVAERPVDDRAVLIGPNHRTYWSQGAAAVARIVVDTPIPWVDTPVQHRVEAGARLHQDQIVRDHREEGFFVVDDALVADGLGETVTAKNRAHATALALHVADEMRVGSVVVVPGVRAEVIDGGFVDQLRGAAPTTSLQWVLLPGLGVGVDVQPWLTVLGGVHRGFSPVAPGQTARVRAEESTNAELGLRMDATKTTGLSAEAITFFSHYDNIVGECTFSAGCVDDVGAQENGGAAAIGGLELAARHALPLHVVGDADVLRTEASFTWTQARFLTDFSSSHPLMGRVRAGDELTYMPALQGSLQTGATLGVVDAGVSMGVVSAMRDVPGQSPWSQETAAQWTDAQVVVDVVTAVEFVPGWRVAVRLDNALDQRAIVSRRPFGARPGKPRSALLSLEADLGG
jgi:Fe(3+) dicitrate transport protein